MTPELDAMAVEEHQTRVIINGEAISQQHFFMTEQLKFAVLGGCLVVDKVATALVHLLALAAVSTADEPSCAPMKIAVIGATGGVGAHVTRLAIEQGHTVVAVARNLTKITAEANEKRLVDFSHREGLQRVLADALKGCDLVLSCIGNRRGETPIVERGTRAIMAAMSRASVPRMAMVSSIGVGDSRLQLLRLGFGGWIFSAIFATILRTTKADLNAV